MANSCNRKHLAQLRFLSHERSSNPIHEETKQSILQALRMKPKILSPLLDGLQSIIFMAGGLMNALFRGMIKTGRMITSEWVFF